MLLTIILFAPTNQQNFDDHISTIRIIEIKIDIGLALIYDWLM